MQIIKITHSIFKHLKASIFSVLLAGLLMSHGSYASASDLSQDVGAEYQQLVSLNNSVNHVYIYSLLFFDGELRAQDTMQDAISSVDSLLANFSTDNVEIRASLSLMEEKWAAVLKSIDDVPEDPYFFYLDKLTKASNSLVSVIDQSIQSLKSRVNTKNYNLYLANAGVLDVVSIHLGSAIMDVGNDAESKAVLSEKCEYAAGYIERVSHANAKIKSYVLRSWKYIQKPICNTGKLGGEYTIAHFAKKISSKILSSYDKSSVASNLAGNVDYQ